MASKIIECVPNFSEGRNKEVIEAISSAISSTPGCMLLDVDPGVSTNRTVYTFVGSPEAVIDGAYAAARTAFDLIDITKHKGEHPRMGTLDVCPFIPVRNTTIEECVEVSKIFAERLSKDLNVPIYLYGFSQHKEYRKTMPQIRAGEYEGLQEKLKSSEWQPDYGPVQFVPRWGATVTGSRKFLIAYNVNMISTKEQAHRVALNIREQGRGPNEPGRLKCCQAIGWYLDEANIAQVSVNLLDFEVTALHTAFEEVKKDAEERILPVVGSEIVGLVPLKAMLDAAEYYIKKENLFVLEEDQKIRLAIDRLGLGTLNAFVPKEKIVEYILDQGSHGPLQDLSVYDFVRKIGARCPAPGGGSVSALIASLGAALGTMVGLLTYGNRRFETLDSQMRTLVPVVYETMMGLLPMIDADAAAFAEYMNACKLPQGTSDEKNVREQAMQASLRNCVEVPIYVARSVDRCWPVIRELAKIGNVNTKSDLQVGIRALNTGVWGAYYNIEINIEHIHDTKYKNAIMQEANQLTSNADSEMKQSLEILGRREAS